MTQDLQSAIAAKRREIRELLLEEALLEDLAAEIDFDLPESSPIAAATWPVDVGALADFVLLLSVEDLPAAPFVLEPHRTVIDADKYLRALQRDVAAGPGGPRALTGDLYQELQRIHNLVIDHDSVGTVLN